jgi:nicotinamide-nucleotide amidase
MSDGLGLALDDTLRSRLRKVLEGLDRRDLTVAGAESCTAGLVSAAISGCKGLGHVLDCAFVTYSNEAKARLLGVPADLIDQDGAVSESVARAMAQGALQRAEAPLAYAVTGFAGPAGPDDEEGLVHFALARQNKPTVHRVEHFGPIGQDAVRLAALDVVIDLLAHHGEPS